MSTTKQQQQSLTSTINSLKPQKTNWKVLGYDGASGTGGSGLIKFQVGGSVNALRVQQPGSAVTWIYTCGIEVSCGLTSSPINADASTPPIPTPGVNSALQTPNVPPISGIAPGVYSLPASLGNVSANSFRGYFIAVNCAVSGLATYNVNFLFMGSHFYGISSSGQFGSQSLKAILSSQVMVVVYGFSMSLPDISLTTTFGIAA